MLELRNFFRLCLLRVDLGILLLRQCFGINPLNNHPIFFFTINGKRFEQILSALNCSNKVVPVHKNDRIANISS